VTNSWSHICFNDF